MVLKNVWWMEEDQACELMRSRPGCDTAEEGEGSRRPSEMMGVLLGMERAESD